VHAPAGGVHRPFRAVYARPVSSPDIQPGYVPSAEDAALVEALRAGDEDAFMRLVEEYGPQMLAIAMLYTPTRAVAEDVVGETWLAVLDGLDRFEGRSSLKTWIFRILANRARSRGTRERRSVPFSSLRDADDGRSVDPDRFLPAGDARAGRWAAAPARWGELPEERLLARETVEAARAAIEALPPAQRTVITLRDVEGWDAAEVADLLGLSDGNQRVLLHRARSKVRRALEREFEGAA
jgi:RNA polymerase sigma-70 factor, ECF subfamily